MTSRRTTQAAAISIECDPVSGGSRLGGATSSTQGCRQPRRPRGVRPRRIPPHGMKQLLCPVVRTVGGNTPTSPQRFAPSGAHFGGPPQRSAASRRVGLESSGMGPPPASAQTVGGRCRPRTEAGALNAAMVPRLGVEAWRLVEMVSAEDVLRCVAHQRDTAWEHTPGPALKWERQVSAPPRASWNRGEAQPALNSQAATNRAVAQCGPRSSS